MRSRPCVSRSLICCLALVGLVLLSGCEGIQSALEPAGRDAERIRDLTLWLFGGAFVVWIVVIGIALYAVRLRPEKHPRRRTAFLVVGGGVVLPVIVLTVYLVYGLSMLPEMIEPAPEGALQITVSGEQWWWRVLYEGPDGEEIQLANELRLPVGERVQLYLNSPDVIHSFWVPSIGGKIDMIPGRTTRHQLEPTRTGIFRGACAEYCGESHALMNFYLVVQEREEFEAWLERQAEPAAEPETALAARGEEIFISNGCGACHAVRGTPADGVVGPDLTHVGSRVSLAAGVLTNEPDDFVRWVAHTEELKPGVHMPAFGMLPEEEIAALAAYLDGLK